MPSPLPAHVQLALDEVLLDRLIAGRRGPTLRFWEWAEPALVLGSHQVLANEVDLAAAAGLGFTVARRMSGGGTMIVEPGRSITYSLYAPESVVAGLSFVDSFAFLDAWVKARRAQGMAAISVNWGAWRDGGMVTDDHRSMSFEYWMPLYQTLSVPSGFGLPRANIQNLYGPSTATLSAEVIAPPNDFHGCHQ